MCKIQLKSTSQKSITLYSNFLKYLFKQLNLQYKIVHLSSTYKNIALLKSPHVYKKAKEHFGAKTFKTVIILNIAPSAEMLKHFFINKPKSIFVQSTFSTRNVDEKSEQKICLY